MDESCGFEDETGKPKPDLGRVSSVASNLAAVMESPEDSPNRQADIEQRERVFW